MSLAPSVTRPLPVMVIVRVVEFQVTLPFFGSWVKKRLLELSVQAVPGSTGGIESSSSKTL